MQNYISMTISFQSLGISEARSKQLETLGFDQPTDVQTQAIPEILKGNDVVGQSQTGTGKTAAFSLPILEQIDVEHTAVQALILTPTRELAQQVADAIQTFSHDRALKILTVYGGQSIERQIQQLKRGVQVIVGTPGRIIDLLNRKALRFDTLRYVVLDEADEMLSMGFIDDVREILRQAPEQRQTACFSATMPRQIQDLIKQFMDNPVRLKVDQPKGSPKQIQQRVYKVPRGWNKIQALKPVLAVEDPESALIFVRTKRTANEINQQLQASGYSVDEYHGDLSQIQRERLVQRFRNNQVRLVVATDIAARGLDVQDLSHVINFDLPDNIETYIHRIGRTGRAGKEGIAVSLSLPRDRHTLRQIEGRMRQRLNFLSIPKRSEIEAQRLEKLREDLHNSLGGERMASFLPLVRELSDEYDPHAIAAAALQMIYDESRPNWLDENWQDPPSEGSKPKPKPRNKGNSKPSVRSTSAKRS